MFGMSSCASASIDGGTAPGRDAAARWWRITCCLCCRRGRRQDCKRVRRAAVMFMPAGGGRPATGVTDAQGKYQLQTFNANDGAILGEHRVSVTMPETGSGPGTKTAQGSISGSSTLSPAPATTGYEKYAKPSDSGLTAQVTRDAKPIDFHLKAAR